MKKFQLILLGVALAAVIAACGGGHSHEGHDHDHDGSATMDSTHMQAHGMGMEYTSTYVCPMHCAGSGNDKPGTCPKCGMNYISLTDHMEDGHVH